jgi:hypothetical protein
MRGKGVAAYFDAAWTRDAPIPLAQPRDVFSGTHGATALKQLTRTVPIVFVNVADPVGTGIVDSLARPGGNITGFMAFDFSFSGKYLDLLKEIAPHVTRVAVFRDETNPAGIVRCYSGHGDLSWAASNADQRSQQ